MGKHKKPNSSDPDVQHEPHHSERSNRGQGGHIGQLQKLESTQTETHQWVKKNPAQDALKNEDDLEAGHAHDEGLSVRSSSADDEDDCNVPFPSLDDSDMHSPPQVSDDFGAKKQRHAQPIPLSKPTCTIFLNDIDIQPSSQVPNRFHSKNFKKHTHPITPSADNNSIQRHHPIVSPSRSMNSDIPSHPHRVPKPASNSIALDTVHDVLQEHCAKNWCHRPPDPRTLQKSVALGATALAAAIDEYKTGIYKPMKFVSELYQPIYDSVMQLYDDVKLDPYHSKKCRAVLSINVERSRVA
ncbi:uncharacterized protein F5891DRAFT_1186061 [Suillus fuscotomentosus]|uniref:DUF6532 domain-containing protein n=1 Tax=Suillus fuscotomentosus TaxID=1912939 RepID=A0AAD4EAX1_9AGAM|nr:uncharacterized protein F5891DRAFT_1186061 [Suillus fuscotomentosus]KAG1902918.1 hypothetical protein F5891DRAFT_1186061 [Suillus fuscotomentosus]